VGLRDKRGTHSAPIVAPAGSPVLADFKFSAGILLLLFIKQPSDPARVRRSLWIEKYTKTPFPKHKNAPSCALTFSY
jgi:hypothetical protein